MLSSELEICLNEAFQSARESRHEFMTVEHLLLALLDNASATTVLKASGAQIAHSPSSNLFLGSGIFDWRAAEAAGAPAVWSSWGYGTAHSLAQAPRWRIDRPAQLAELLGLR